MHGWSCVQGSEWLVPQVALLHTWAGEDQCRVNLLQKYYLPLPIEPLLLLLLLLLLYLPAGLVTD